MSIQEHEGFVPVDGYRVWKGIAHSEWILLENSSHLAHVEEPEVYMQTVRNFLDRVEQNNK
jgi:pimeloyl-ACP methyl ester carboxylesterase